MPTLPQLPDLAALSALPASTVAALVALATTVALLFLTQVLARASLTALAQRFGWRAVPFTTGWLGVPVHELSHALACVLTRRRIREIRLFAPDPATGIVGSVTYEPGRGPLAWLAGLVVGLAPLAGGTGVLQGLALLAAPSSLGAGHAAAKSPHLPASLSGLAPMLADLHARGLDILSSGSNLWHGDAWHRAALVAWTLASFSVAVHLVPSRADLKGAWRGALLLVALAGLGATALVWRGVPFVDRVARAVLTTASWILPGLCLAVILLVVLRMTVAIAGRLWPFAAPDAKVAAKIAAPVAARAVPAR